MSSPRVTFNLTCGNGVTELQNLTYLSLSSFAESHQMQQKNFEVSPNQYSTFIFSGRVSLGLGAHAQCHLYRAVVCHLSPPDLQVHLDTSSCHDHRHLGPRHAHVNSRSGRLGDVSPSETAARTNDIAYVVSAKLGV